MSRIVELNNKLITKQISAEEIVEEHIKQIEKYNDEFLSVIEHKFNEIRLRAKVVDNMIAKDDNIGLLAAVPYGVKDNIHVSGYKITGGCKKFENRTAYESAACVDALNSEGAIMMGKLNLDEFGVGDITKSFKGHTRNPYNSDFDLSGSSGGSAAFVSLDFGYFALGSDTGGSIREPAGKGGLSGLKPTYNAISKEHCYGYAPSLDTIGPLAYSVCDLAITMEVMGRKDPKDKEHVHVNFSNAYGRMIQPVKEKIKIAVLKQVNDLDPQGDEEYLKYHEFVDGLKKEKGIEVFEVSMPSVNKTTAMYRLVTAFEGHDLFKSLLDTDAKEETLLFDNRVRQRMLMAKYYDDNHPDYRQKVQTDIIQLNNEYSGIMADYDFIITPLTSLDENQNLVTLANFSRCPSVSIPIGVKSNNVPCGVQLFGKYGEDVRLLQLARVLEAVASFDHKPPAIIS